MEVRSADVLRLVQAHLLESGLSESVRVLQKESGVLLRGQLVRNYAFHAGAGNWGAVLESLSYVDPDLVITTSEDEGDGREADKVNNNKKKKAPPPLPRQRRRLRELIADVHEMTILELAEAGDLALAYATFRVVQKDWDEQEKENPSSLLTTGTVEAKPKKKKSKHATDDPGSTAAAALPHNMTRARVLEQKLAALAAYQAGHPPPKGTGAPLPIPDDYYGSAETTKQQRRDGIGRRLDEAIPLVPRQRLVSLLQQAVSWQAHTGQLPTIQHLWHDDDNDDDEIEENDDDDPNDEHASRKKRRRSSRHHRKEFDLVLGTAHVDPVPVGTRLDRSARPVEPIPARPWSVVKLGKRTRPESAVFLPDGGGLVTGSSDGLIEVWGADSRYESLIESLDYQKRDELMGHDGGDGGGDGDTSITALAVSNDGQVLVSADASGLVKVWNVQTGRCLRSIRAHSKAVHCLCLAPDATQLLTSSRDGTCREFGLRTSRMLKEFGPHGGSVSHCSYRVVDDENDDSHAAGYDDDENLDTAAKRLLVVTASSDGAVRIWDRTSQELIRTLRPASTVPGRATALSVLLGSSMVVADAVPSSSNEEAVGSPPIQAVLPLHTPHGAMIVVPRGPRAFMVDVAGTVLRMYDVTAGAADPAHPMAFVDATVSRTNQWLYGATDDGALFVFSVETGKLETSLPDFGDDTMPMSKDASGGGGGGAGFAEITGMVHHPNRSILAAFSNSKSQKKGQVVLWK